MKIMHMLGDRFLPTAPEKTGVSGVVRVPLEIARVQAQQGHHVTVAAVAEEARRTTWQGVHLVHIRAIPWARISLKSRSINFQTHLPYMLLTRLVSLDILHAHHHIYLRFLRARGRVAHFHVDPFYPGRNNEGLDLKPLDFQTIARYTDRQIGVSQFVTDQLRQGLGSQGNVSTVYNGVQIDDFAPSRWQEKAKRLRNEWGATAETVVFLFAGALVSEKGVIHLAQAFANLAQKIPTVHLALAGSVQLWHRKLSSSQDTPNAYEKQVREILQDMHAAGRVHFLGKISPAEMPAVFHASDVTVVPSIVREAFGMVALEALASGCPVIASQTGGLVELVNEQNGMLVPVGDEEALGTAMGKFASDADLRKQCGIAARETARYFSWQNAVRQIDALYHDILTSRKR